MDKQPKAPRTCPTCQATFTPAQRSQAFCCHAHQVAFHRTMAKFGTVAMPLVLAWRAGKHRKSATSAYALGQLAALADSCGSELKAAAVAVAERKRQSGWVAADLR
jgi:hypothetical protein